MQKEKELLMTTKTRKLEYLNHILRNNQKYGLLHLYFKEKLKVREGLEDEGYRGWKISVTSLVQQ